MTTRAMARMRRRYLCLGAREDEPKPIERVAKEPWEYAASGDSRADWMRL